MPSDEYDDDDAHNDQLFQKVEWTERSVEVVEGEEVSFETIILKWNEFLIIASLAPPTRRLS